MFVMLLWGNKFREVMNSFRWSMKWLFIPDYPARRDQIFVSNVKTRCISSSFEVENISQFAFYTFFVLWSDCQYWWCLRWRKSDTSYRCYRLCDQCPSGSKGSTLLLMFMGFDGYIQTVPQKERHTWNLLTFSKCLAFSPLPNTTVGLFQ